MKDKDSEQQYPSRRPRRANGNGNGQQNIPIDEQEIIIRPRKSRLPSSTPSSSPASSIPSRRSVPSRPPQLVPAEEDERADEPLEPTLPPNGLLYALIAGVVGGVLTILLNVAITFLNADTFAQAARAIDANKLSTGAAYAITGLACLNLFIGIATAVVTGYIIGKIAVQRRLGFYTGALVGIIVYLGSFLVRYIPNYPGNVSASNVTAGGAATGLLISFIFLCVWGGIGGLLGLFGTRTATRNHPYYMKYVEDEEDEEE